MITISVGHKDTPSPPLPPWAKGRNVDRPHCPVLHASFPRTGDITLPVSYILCRIICCSDSKKGIDDSFNQLPFSLFIKQENTNR